MSNENNVPGYEALGYELKCAYDQSARGKGAHRHADGLAWAEQPLFTTARRHGSGFLSGQAEKKLGEAVGMVKRGEVEKAIHEIHGAIVYAAAFANYLRNHKE